MKQTILFYPLTEHQKMVMLPESCCYLC